MLQESHEKLRKFEQKMHQQGADGFADGPRPWERWDESGHQANNRIWEGSAKRVNARNRKHSLGHRLLSVLALVALGTLLVGIGGVYYSHTQTQQLAQTGSQPLPVIDRPPSRSKAVVTAETQANDLNILPAPVADTEPQPPQLATVAETATAGSEVTPPTDEPAHQPAGAITAVTSTEALPPAANGVIDSVAIETVITEQSVTTTVYTRHPRQDEAEIVAAIETTPPPFAHERVAEQTPPADALPTTAADTEALTEQVLALSALPPPAAQASTPAAAETRISDDTGATSAHDAQPDTVAVEQPVEPIREDTVIALADISDETSLTEPAEETAAVASEVPYEAAPVEAPAETTGAATTIALAEEISETTTIVAPPEDIAVETANEPLIESMEPVTPPVTKTGDWVINLSSYTWKSTANRKLAQFQQQGIDAEVFEVMIKDKPMYRIRVVGFENRHAAKAEIPVLEQKLELEGAWISKR